MPIYEYACKHCQERTSILVRSFTAPATVRCEHCGGEETERALSAPAVRMGPLNEEKGKPSEEAQAATRDAKMRKIAQAEVHQAMKKLR